MSPKPIVESDAVYAFDQNEFLKNTAPELMEQVQLPPYFVKDPQLVTLYLCMGGDGSGVQFHKHADTWNAQIFGRKRWLLIPPAHAYYSTRHFSDDYATERREEHTIECVQQSGDVLFLPALWGHGVLYERMSIGASFLYQGGFAHKAARS